MGLEFYAVKKRIPSGPREGQELYYAQVRCEQPVSLEKICEKITDHTSVTYADVLVVLEGFAKVVCNQLDKGNIVQLGDLGNVRVVAGSTGADTEKGFQAHMMKRGRVALVPGKLLTRACTEVSIRKMKVKVVEEDCPQPHVDPPTP